jgi:UPF0755 protein
MDNNKSSDNLIENEETSGSKAPLVRVSRKKVISYLVALVLVFVGYYIFTPPSDYPENSYVTISPGENLKSVSRLLSDKGYIRSNIIFQSFVIIFGGERNISSGDYYFGDKMSVEKVAWQIAKGEHGVEQLKITIPEGRNSSEIAEILSSKFQSFDKSQFVKEAKENEGYLFPETYFFYPSSTSEYIIESMKNMFSQKTAEMFKEISDPKEKQNIIILASLVEREAHGSDDRGIVAGIIKNRLDAGMPLQIDATVAYAKGVPEGAIRKEDLKINSPYNTYIVLGLPPTPIANPGLTALNSALNPVITNYMYYLHDKKGNIHYAKTYAEHLRNIVKYLR